MTKHQMDENCSQVRTIAVMGAARTGKTSLLARFFGQPFEERHTPTVEDYHQAKFFVGETLYHTEITDTSGSFEFPAMEKLTMDKADAFVFVYSVEDDSSFERVETYLKRLNELKDVGKVPVIIVCNKADVVDINTLRDMQLRLDTGELPFYREKAILRSSEEILCAKKERLLSAQLEQVRQFGCEFLLTSAKFRWNVNRIFQLLFRSELCRSQQQQQQQKSFRKRANLTNVMNCMFGRTNDKDKELQI